MADAVFFHIIDAEFTAAGILGGLFHAYLPDKPAVREVVRFMALGGLAGNFLTPGIIVIGASALNFIAPRVLEILALLPPFTLAFVVGACGRPIGFAIEVMTTNWLGKEKEND